MKNLKSKGPFHYDDSENNDLDYKALFEYSNDAIIIHNFNGKIIEANYKVRDLLALKIERIKLHNFADFLPNRKINIFKKATKEIKDKGYKKYEIELIKSCGDFIPVEIRAGLIDENKPIVAAVIRDISIIKKQKENL